jgi:hypothetical protein
MKDPSATNCPAQMQRLGARRTPLQSPARSAGPHADA